MASRDRLATYLNDHLMGSAGARDLAEHSRAKVDGSELATFLGWLRDQIEEDRAELLGLMVRLGISEHRLKHAAGAVAEKVSRFKLDELRDEAADLNRMLELESLQLGIEGKHTLWRTLQQLARSDPELAQTDYDRLIERARQQAAEIDGHRRQLVDAAFA